MTSSTAGAPDPGRLVIGSRRSTLARAQAGLVGDALREAWPGLDVRYVGITTEGDRDRETPLPEIGGKGLFTRELERALADGDIDVAVHSLKDLPTGDDDTLVAIPRRADPADVLILRDGLDGAADLSALPEGLRIGTSSTRRAAQLVRAVPAVQPTPVRGNVGTRLRRVAEGELDGVVLAAAGLARLGTAPPNARRLDPAEWLPAPAQGALAVQGRAADDRVTLLVAVIADAATTASVTAERAFLARLGGGCHVPVAALATVTGDRLHLSGAVFGPDSSGGPLVAREEGEPGEAAALGTRAGTELLGRGAAAFMERDENR